MREVHPEGDPRGPTRTFALKSFALRGTRFEYATLPYSTVTGMPRCRWLLGYRYYVPLRQRTRYPRRATGQAVVASTFLQAVNVHEPARYFRAPLVRLHP